MSAKMTTPEQKIESFVGKNPGCSRADIAKGTKLDATKLSVTLRKMVEANTLSMTGRTRGARYTKPAKPISATPAT